MKESVIKELFLIYNDALETCKYELTKSVMRVELQQALQTLRKQGIYITPHFTKNKLVDTFTISIAGEPEIEVKVEVLV